MIEEKKEIVGKVNRETGLRVMLERQEEKRKRDYRAANGFQMVHALTHKQTHTHTEV